MRFFIRFAGCCIFVSLIIYILEYFTFYQISYSYTPTLHKMFKFLEENVPSIIKNILSRNYCSRNPIDYWRCTNGSTCVYSAFWDNRFIPSFVRLIGATSSTANVSTWKCLLRYNETTSIETPVILIKMPDNHDKPKTSAFFICNAASKPLEAKLFDGDSHTQSISVQSMEQKRSARGRIAVCVRPLFGYFHNYNIDIAEFIAYYRILGANHFTFYDFQVKSPVKQFFDELLNNGISIDFLPWDLPKVVEDSWSSAQHTAIADCIYRNSRDYEYVAVVDVDEYMMPREDVTLQKLVEGLNKPNHNFSTYIFRNTFFCKEAENEPTSASLPFPLVTQQKVKRQKTIYPKRKRSKYIVRPSAVITPGIHFTWSALKSWTTLTVEPHIALLHHYRGEACNLNREPPNKFMTDTKALRYRTRIVKSTTMNVWEKMKG